MRTHQALIAATAVAVVCVRPASAASCESLARLSLSHVTVTLANMVDAGAFVQFPAARAGGGGAPPPVQGRGAGGGRGGAPASPFADVPAFCRVMATLTPSADSEIKMEL